MEEDRITPRSAVPYFLVERSFPHGPRQHREFAVVVSYRTSSNRSQGPDWAEPARSTTEALKAIYRFQEKLGGQDGDIALMINDGLGNSKTHSISKLTQLISTIEGLFNPPAPPELSIVFKEARLALADTLARLEGINDPSEIGYEHQDLIKVMGHLRACTAMIRDDLMSRGLLSDTIEVINPDPETPPNPLLMEALKTLKELLRALNMLGGD